MTPTTVPTTPNVETRQGMATPAELGELHGLVVRGLLDATQERPSAEMLAVARSVLRDNGLLGMAANDKDRKALQRLYRVYVRQLLEAMQAETVPAALLAECRVFLAGQGITKDLGGVVTKAAALKVLGSSSLPFKTTH